jgi:hypothetical protein
LLPLISAFIAPNWRHHGRYLIPLIPFINIVSIDILRKFVNALEEKGTRFFRFAGKAIPLILIIFSNIHNLLPYFRMEC